MNNNGHSISLQQHNAGEAIEPTAALSLSRGQQSQQATEFGLSGPSLGNRSVQRPGLRLNTSTVEGGHTGYTAPDAGYVTLAPTESPTESDQQMYSTATSPLPPYSETDVPLLWDSETRGRHAHDDIPHFNDAPAEPLDQFQIFSQAPQAPRRNMWTPHQRSSGNRRNDFRHHDQPATIHSNPIPWSIPALPLPGPSLQNRSPTPTVFSDFEWRPRGRNSRGRYRRQVSSEHSTPLPQALPNTHSYIPEVGMTQGAEPLVRQVPSLTPSNEAPVSNFDTEFMNTFRSSVRIPSTELSQGSTGFAGSPTASLSWEQLRDDQTHPDYERHAVARDHDAPSFFEPASTVGDALDGLLRLHGSGTSARLGSDREPSASFDTATTTYPALSGSRDTPNNHSGSTPTTGHGGASQSLPYVASHFGAFLPTGQAIPANLTPVNTSTVTGPSATLQQDEDSRSPMNAQSSSTGMRQHLETALTQEVDRLRQDRAWASRGTPSFVQPRLPEPRNFDRINLWQEQWGRGSEQRGQAGRPAMSGPAGGSEMGFSESRQESAQRPITSGPPGGRQPWARATRTPGSVENWAGRTSSRNPNPDQSAVERLNHDFTRYERAYDPGVQRQHPRPPASEGTGTDLSTYRTPDVRDSLREQSTSESVRSGASGSANSTRRTLTPWERFGQLEHQAAEDSHAQQSLAEERAPQRTEQERDMGRVGSILNHDFSSIQPDRATDRTTQFGDAYFDEMTRDERNRASAQMAQLSRQGQANFVFGPRGDQDALSDFDEDTRDDRIWQMRQDLSDSVYPQWNSHNGMMVTAPTARNDRAAAAQSISLLQRQESMTLPAMKAEIPIEQVFISGLKETVKYDSQFERRLEQLLAENCLICYEQYKDPVETRCGHIYCCDCAIRWIWERMTCPICRAWEVVLGLTRLVVEWEGVERKNGELEGEGEGEGDEEEKGEKVSGVEENEKEQEINRGGEPWPSHAI